MAKIQGDSIGFAKTLSDTVENNYQWRTDRGLEIAKVAIAAIEYDEDSKALLSDVKKADALSGARGNSFLQQSVARGMEAAGQNQGAMGMGMKPFFQKVREVTGKTPAEVVRDLRLKHACVLLQRTNINMSELANNIGFATAEHFMNLFKERFGISPSEYRRRYRK